jgi:UPF0755 protein
MGMKFFAAFLSFCFLVVICAVAGVSYWGLSEYRAPGPLQQDKVFTVKKGLGTIQIANQLTEKDIISDPHIFRVAQYILHADKTLKAGTYQFSAGQTMEEVFEQIEAGRVHTDSVTIAEGLTSWQIVRILNKEFGEKYADIPAEGSLLPETYQYAHDGKEGSVAFIVSRMKTAMDKSLDELWDKRAENLPIKTKQEAIILASIVEKETSVAAERKKVAGVFINRLRKGMLLQTDPTVIYALTNGKIQMGGSGPLGRRLLRKDLQVDSPYNTYKYPGLPPGPIANPGYASIEAVLHPEVHGYIYFVANGTGGHSFAKTLAQHNRNVAEWRKIRKAQ